MSKVTCATLVFTKSQQTDSKLTPLCCFRIPKATQLDDVPPPTSSNWILTFANISFLSSHIMILLILIVQLSKRDLTLTILPKHICQEYSGTENNVKQRSV